MPNRLAESNSPYLLQHKNNPVAWYPWGEEALEKARREDKPIFLSIGYAACHWCHVMAHESFEDPQTAAIMNEHFVNIKVDREERPDLDNIYMNSVVAMTGQGGWPMSVFLTPDLEPFYGGTYFPPQRRYNMPSFREVLTGVARAWQEDREGIRNSGRQIAAQLTDRGQLGEGVAGSLQEKTLDEAAFRLAQSYDWTHGGWGKAPKFPQPMAIEFLLRRAARGDKFAREVAEHALNAMARGGMYDVVGGGFARYSTDDEWLVPHFEKMLYDNAQLARAYLHGYLVSGDEHYRQVCEATLDFIARELMARREDGSAESGGFFSSLDADSEGEEGKFYVWTIEEIREAFEKREEAEFILAAYGATEQGNFEGKNILQRKLEDKELAERFNIPLEGVAERLQALHARLLQIREQRVRPGTDDKVLVSWNGLALTAFAEAARYLEREDYLDVARHNADFLLSELQTDDRLMRSWRKGSAQHNAYLEDYAALILGLLALYQVDPDNWWFNSAVQLAEAMIEHYEDPEGGFFDTSDDHGPLLTRPKELQDNATPSGNSLAATALVYLTAYTGKGEWRDRAEQMLGQIQAAAQKYPTAFGQWLCALDAALGPLQEVVIVGDLDSALTRSYMEILRDRYRPNTVLALTPYPPPPNAPPLVKDRPLLDDRPTAYICQNMICQRPVNSPIPFKEQLEAV